MANSHQHLDLTTLQEVERLLTSTEFASIHEVARRASAGPMGPVRVLSNAGGGASRPRDEVSPETSTGPLLPKRR